MKLAEHLLQSATGRRHGIILETFEIPVTPADLPGLFNVAVPALADVDAGPASGGIGHDKKSAELAAIGEALERYAGALALLPSIDPTQAHKTLEWNDFSLYDETQLSDLEFPHAELLKSRPTFTDIYDIASNAQWLAPKALVSLGQDEHSIATSSGLAAHTDMNMAFLRAIQELIERDALMTMWMHEIAGPRIELGSKYTDPVIERFGEVIAIDATPEYSSNPVAIVMGSIPRRGLQRYSLGASCRATWNEAVDKAYLEWAQGLTFIGDRLLRTPQMNFVSSNDVRSFDDHALYYSANPHLWNELPILKGSQTDTPKDSNDHTLDIGTQIHNLVTSLNESGFRTFYRNMTTVDLQQIGVHAIRVLSPDLVPVHHDHRFPHLGGTAKDVKRRHPWWNESGQFPSKYPHPLG